MTRLGTAILWYFIIAKDQGEHYGRAYHYRQSRDESLAFRVELGEEL